MAFPTSSLTNNQVHKEGNRAFVYDSALGVWDQVRETDITDGKNLYGEIDRVTYPAGHVLQVKHSYSSASLIAVSATGTLAAKGNAYYTFTWGTEIITTVANSLIYLTAQIGNAHSAAGNPQVNLGISRYKAGIEEALVGATATTGATGGGIGYTTGGPTYGMTRSTSMDAERTMHMSFLDKPLDPSGTVLKYYLIAYVTNTTSNIGANSINSLTAMEIMP